MGNVIISWRFGVKANVGKPIDHHNNNSECPNMINTFCLTINYTIWMNSNFSRRNRFDFTKYEIKIKEIKILLYFVESQLTDLGQAKLSQCRLHSKKKMIIIMFISLFHT